MYIICVNANYVDEQWFEPFKDEVEAEERYKELLETYKDKTTQEVEIYFTMVIEK